MTTCGKCQNFKRESHSLCGIGKCDGPGSYVYGDYTYSFSTVDNCSALKEVKKIEG
jgi:hypothetical protein